MAKTRGTGLLMVWADIDPEFEAEYHRWYDEEHIAHLLAGTSVTEIQSTSGTGWAVVAAAAAVLATASFLTALGLLIVSLVHRRPAAVAATAQAARRGA